MGYVRRGSGGVITDWCLGPQSAFFSEQVDDNSPEVRAFLDRDTSHSAAVAAAAKLQEPS